MKKILNFLIKFFPTRPVFAHCDIPCGIYDPYEAQLAVHTIIRMVGLINDLKISSENAPFEERKAIIHKISRMTSVKEHHAKKVEEEVVTLWADYFKEENSGHIDNLHDHIWQTIKLASQARQEVDIEVAKALLAHVQVLAEMFWQSKGFEPIRIPSGYPTGGEIVSHK